MKIYLAGKITEHGWRESIVGRGDAIAIDIESGAFTDRPLAALDRQYRHHRCTGPFFLDRCHGNSNHGNYSHGVGANGVGCCSGLDSSEVVSLCLDAIRRSDLVFAWMDHGYAAHGTIAELGYAKAIGVPIWLAARKQDPDLWFIQTMADRTLWGFSEASDALCWYLDNSSVLPQSVDIYLKQAAADPEIVAARKLFTEFGPAGVRVPIPRHIRSAVWAKTGGTCWYCKKPTNPYDDFQVDHVTPVSKGGANRIDNLVPSCQTCNASKRDRAVSASGNW